MDNPTQDDMNKMVEAIFVKTDQFRAKHGLDAPADQTGFVELLRLVFDENDEGRAIFATMDEALFDVLYKIYTSRPKTEATFEVDAPF